MLLCRTLFCAVLWIGELSQLLPKIKELVRSVFLTLDSHLFSEESLSVALTSVLFTVARAKGQFSCPIAWTVQGGCFVGLGSVIRKLGYCIKNVFLY